MITELRLWVEDGEGDVISTGAGGAATLAQNGPPEILSVRVLHHDRQEQNLIVEWSDADSEHRDEPGIHPPAAYIHRRAAGRHDRVPLAPMAFRPVCTPIGTDR